MNKPVNLCRYRSMKDKNLSALQQGRLYFSSPSFFNDPFDPFVYVDAYKLVNSIDYEIIKGLKSGYIPKSFFKPNVSASEARATFEQYFENPMQRTGLILKALHEINVIREQIKNNSKVICLSEDFLSAPMWAHYAGDQGGFALIYNPEDLEKATIFDENDRALRLEVMLDRVNYSAEAPDFGQVFFEELPRRMPFIRGNANRRFHHSLIYNKKLDWANEKEWRLCAVGDDVSRPCRAHYLSVKPLAVAFGFKMKEDDKKRIAYIVKDMGVLLLEVFPDTSNPKLALTSRPYFPM